MQELVSNACVIGAVQGLGRLIDPKHLPQPITNRSAADEFDTEIAIPSPPATPPRTHSFRGNFYVSRSKRLLEPAELPLTLWEAGTEILNLAPSLSDAYVQIIEQRGLRELGMTRDSKDPPVGGKSREAAEKHFAQQFDGSAARAQLALTDPKDDLQGTSNSVVRCLNGGKLALIDAPCGSGAASLAFLTSVAELRKQKVMPRQPLDVTLLGGEISEDARKLAGDLLAELSPILRRQAIFVTASFSEWDVTCPHSTASLIKIINRSTENNQTMLLVVANFSGFLATKGKWNESKRQLEQLFLHACGDQSAAVWLEPPTNKVLSSGGLFDWVIRHLSRLFPLKPVDSDEGAPNPVAISQARFRLPLNPVETARVVLAVMPIDLLQSK